METSEEEWVNSENHWGDWIAYNPRLNIFWSSPTIPWRPTNVFYVSLRPVEIEASEYKWDNCISNIIRVNSLNHLLCKQKSSILNLWTTSLIFTIILTSLFLLPNIQNNETSKCNSIVNRFSWWRYESTFRK